MDKLGAAERGISLAGSAVRPLAGMTVLVVEDSRFACESVRLLCLRSGARIRRADSLSSARRHLKAYRPTIAIIDLGLPDGSGADLIDQLSRATPRVPVIIGLSGDSVAEQICIAAGADGFIAKPIESIARFQSMIVGLLPEELRPSGVSRLIVAGREDNVPSPDPLAFHDDMAHVLSILTDDDSEENLDYVAQFAAGLARSAEDTNLGNAANELALARANGKPIRPAIAKLACLAQERIAVRTQI